MFLFSVRKKRREKCNLSHLLPVDAIRLINICAGVPAGTAVRWTVLPFSPLFTARHVIESRLKMSRLLLLFWVCLLPFFYRFLLMNESILGVILFPGGGFRILYWQFYYLWQWERIDFRLRVNSLRDAGKKNVRKQVIWAFLVLIFYPWEKDEKSLKLNDSISQFHQHMIIAKFISTGRWWPRSLQPRYNSLKFIQSNENTISIRHHQLNSTLRPGVPKAPGQDGPLFQ